ncbi:MAG: rRNA maturation RNase YbeY [Bacteroidales bacterium]|nr:rRNA maturation RNase YbeY [Bacteroidales bacterium]
MIHFYSESVDFPNIDQELVRRWISSVAKTYGKRVGELTYLFCDDAKILEVNRQFLDHDYYTDIITFDNTEGKTIAGDLLISLDTVRTNAIQQGVDYLHELHRVIIHGVLHLCGIDDKGPGQREVMEGEEDKALRLIVL